METWPAILLLSLVAFVCFMAWARWYEGPSAEFANYGLGKKIQTLAIIFLGCVIVVAVACGLVDAILHGYGDGSVF